MCPPLVGIAPALTPVLCVPVVCVEPRIRPVGEDHAGRMTACSIALRADETSDRGSHTIGSDHELSRHHALTLLTIPEAHATDATVVCADEVRR